MPPRREFRPKPWVPSVVVTPLIAEQVVQYLGSRGDPIPSFAPAACFLDLDDMPLAAQLGDATTERSCTEPGQYDLCGKHERFIGHAWEGSFSRAARTCERSQCAARECAPVVRPGRVVGSVGWATSWQRASPAA